jgi:Ca-activated chloride channel family protein
MRFKFFPLFVVALTILVAFPTPAHADGIIVPEPPHCDPHPCPPPPCPGPLPCPVRPPISQLTIRYHHVDVTIKNQVAVTHVDQVFYNPNDWQVEGTYIFPIPVNAVVTSFTLWVDGQPVEGRILDAEEARRTYEEIVYNLRDPALLEYAGQGAMQARIFPIPAQGERRVELEYSQVLTADNGLVRYVYPLNTEKFSLWPLDDVSVSVDVQSSSVPIRAIYSPSHDVSVARESNNHILVGYEDSDVRPETDFSLFYSLGEEQAFHLLPFRDPGDVDADGYFLLLLAPRPDAAAQTLPKDLILILDQSGSMDGEKFQQAQEALRYILQHLNAQDRFNIIAFSTGMDTYARDLRPASEVNEALPWVDRLSAQGSTDINRALLEAAAITDRERPTYLIFLTDGLPTEGIVDSQRILENFASAAADNLRLFSFGVGYDVDTLLLDSLALEHHGTSTYVRPGERIDETLSAFYTKISTPVLTDLELDFGEIIAYDIFPNPMPDLFVGSQISVVGRYRQGGQTTVTLNGIMEGETQSFRFEDQNFISDAERRSSDSPVPRLWATRKIGYLLNQIRLSGPDQETIDQIVRLSIRYGIVTQYTSYLVTEEIPLGAAEQDRIASEQLDQMQSMAPEPAYGRQAVEKAAEQGALAGAEAPVAPAEGAADVVRIIGSRTFIEDEGMWLDTGYDPSAMETIKVQFLSKEYYELVRARPELAAGFSVGRRVVAMSEGVAYEVVSPAVMSDLSEDQIVKPGDVHSSPTSDPINPTPLEVEVTPLSPTGMPQSDPDLKPGLVPCSSGLLPLVVSPLFVFILIRRRRTIPVNGEFRDVDL